MRLVLAMYLYMALYVYTANLADEYPGVHDIYSLKHWVVRMLAVNRVSCADDLQSVNIILSQCYSD